MEADYITLNEEELKQITNKDCVNINIGVLGHVDSGKTSICKVLSYITSTASLDKNPQSQERGITLDLGFSAFFTKCPARLEPKANNKKYLQFTLVDCPGHASLIKTVIGGAQIIDLMFLIIDINEGIQTQTAECICIGELFIDKVIVVLNKVDKYDPQLLTKRIQALRKIFAKTKYGDKVVMVPFSAKDQVKVGQYARTLKNTLLDSIDIPVRNDKGNLLMLIDHCFPIKGKGSVVTGTVIQGAVKAGDQVEFPLIQQRKKVKSMQMFKKPVNSASQGDRVALLFTQLESDLIERGLCCTPGIIHPTRHCVIDFHKIRYYKQQILSKSKLHVISGHQTVMAELRIIFSTGGKGFDLANQYECAESYQKILQLTEKQNAKPEIFCVLNFERDLYANVGTTLVGYKFDGDINQNICRLAFHGTILATLQAGQHVLKLFKNKSKHGIVDKIVDQYTLLIKQLFKKEVNINKFIGREIILDVNGLVGKIHSPFGNSGKIKVTFNEPVLKDNLTEENVVGSRISMSYKKYYEALKKE